ncbi:MAG: hypothetical protein FWG66_04255, partial [Spirochaetes bacterium]|nr:hypothetical protein [Spirochaetota bacterium]
VVEITPPVEMLPPVPVVPPPAPAPAPGDMVFIPMDSPPAFFLDRARELFGQGNVAGAISVLDQMQQAHPTANSDEVYWLYGQFFEANSPSRDILAALDNYRRLVQRHPLSSRIPDARRRIAFLERFFININ